MDVIPGDYVQADSGERGFVIDIGLVAVFVSFNTEGEEELGVFLRSELTKVEPPPCAT